MQHTLPQYFHPEIEFRPSIFGERIVTGSRHDTIVDLLEVYTHGVVYKPRLDHKQLLEYFEVNDNNTDNEISRGLSLRVMFVSDLNFKPPPKDVADWEMVDIADTSSTAKWMYQRFGTLPLFFSCIVSPDSIVKTGNACFRRCGTDSQALDGIYRMISGHNTKPAHVWFSHKLTDKVPISTYIIHQCPEGAKKLILACTQETRQNLGPLSVDTFLADHCLYCWGQNVIPQRDTLVFFEDATISLLTPTQTAKAVEQLHRLSQVLHIIREDLTDIQERLEYLSTVRQRLLDLRSSDSTWDANGIAESLDFLKSKCGTLKRWTTNYAERTGIRINLFFNLSTQTDSRTNLEIAKLTSDIAVSTQKDSSSMITIAAVTMFFLPGTFVSAIFSQVFFDTEKNDNGRIALVVGSQWWLFPAITLPLTVIVFIVWVLWQRYRNKVALKRLSSGNNIPLTDIPPRPDQIRQLLVH